jgi:flagellar L-ring protein FlgH
MNKPLNRYSKHALVAAALVLSVSLIKGDSLFSAESSRSIIADKKAHMVGDIITVIVQESNTTTKQSNTQTSKSDISAKIKSFFFSPTASTLLTKKGRHGGARELPALEMSSDNKFEGGGKINNSESIVARFGATVVDVLPNDNLIIEGVRQTSFSGESQNVVLRGTVRTYDISPNNTVFSYSLADVSIKLDSKGTVSNSQRKGWFTKAWDVLAPF